MGAVVGLLGGRFGAAAAVGAVAALAIGWLWIANAGLRADLAEAAAREAQLQAAIAEQNAAVERMRSEAASAQAAADQRARKALAARPKANPKTAEEMSRWLTGH